MRCAYALVLFAVAAGCKQSNAAAEDVITSTSGALTVDWTVEGATDPGACTKNGAAAVEITVVNDTNNAPIGTFQQSCTAFTTSVVLDVGVYAAQARLLDAAGGRISTDVSIQSFTIHSNSVLTEPIDFPPSAFRAPPLQ